MRIGTVVAVCSLSIAGAGALEAQGDLRWASGDVQLGLVRDGRFVPLAEPDRTLRLTASSSSRGGSPEAGEIDLRPWEGRLIAVTGEPRSGWMFSVEVREKAGYVVSGAVRRLWPPAAGDPRRRGDPRERALTRRTPPPGAAATSAAGGR